MQSFVDVSEKDGFLYWHLNRPSRLNAIGPTVAKNIQALIDKYFGTKTKSARAPSTMPWRGIIFSAEAVPKANKDYWIAGGDLKELATLKSPKDVKNYINDCGAICRFFETIPLPVIAIIN